MKYFLMQRIPQSHSLVRRVSTSLLLGSIVAVAGVLVEYLCADHKITPLDVIDDMVVGAIAGLVVFAYEQQQHRAILQRISVIAAMNHHVRNALQAISYAPYAEQTKQLKLLEDSVNRIQWALREILPRTAAGPEQLKDKSAEH